MGDSEKRRKVVQGRAWSNSDSLGFCIFLMKPRSGSWNCCYFSRTRGPGDSSSMSACAKSSASR